jgi:hypothetical protein
MQQNICKPTSVLYFYKFIGQQPENSILKLEQIIYEKNKLTVVPTRSQNKLYDFLNILEPPDQLSSTLTPSHPFSTHST